MAVCKSKRTDDAKCRANPTDTGFCFWHDPALTADRLEAARKGGSRSVLPLNEIAPMGTEEIRGLLASVLAGLLTGAIDPTTARAAGYIAQVERRVAESEVFEARIEALERLLRYRSNAA